MVMRRKEAKDYGTKVYHIHEMCMCVWGGLCVPVWGGVDVGVCESVCVFVRVCMLQHACA